MEEEQSIVTTSVEIFKVDTMDTALIVQTFVKIMNKYPNASIEYAIECDTHNKDFEVRRTGDDYVIVVYQHLFY